MNKNFENYGLGRCEPPNFDHIIKHPYASAGQDFVVEKLLGLPTWHGKHNQGEEGACVGHGTSMMLAILNMHQCREQGINDPYIRYNPWWLWDRSKERDSFEQTNPGDSNGTTVRASCDVLRTMGHVLWPNENDPTSIGEIKPSYGIKENQWATTVDQVRFAIFNNIPVSIGVNWYSDFYQPVYKDGEYWIGVNYSYLGLLRGGHCVCIYGASDARQAFRVKNSWGADYPEVWLPYMTMQRLMSEGGEVTLVTDL